jgi:hypothetical protein
MFGSQSRFSARAPDPACRYAVLSEVRKWQFPQAKFQGAGFTLPLVFVTRDMDRRTIVHWEQALAEDGRFRASIVNPRSSALARRIV